MAISFKGAHFPPAVILMGVRWYSAYPLSPGRVPQSCGYYFGTSPELPASSDSAGHEPSKSVFNPSLAPVGLHLSTPSLSASRFTTGILL
jgi:hypothetical protein